MSGLTALSPRASIVPGLFLLLSIVACTQAQRPSPGSAGPQDFIPVRNHGWLTGLQEPQADWHPDSRQIVSRARNGLALYREGQQNARVFTYEDGRQPWDPYWLNHREIVFGPRPEVSRDDQSRIVLPRDGLMITTQNSDRSLGEPRPLSDIGYRPRPWPGQGILASAGDAIHLFSPRGQRRLYEAGFDPQPDPLGPALAWRDTPATGADFWTGIEGHGSYLVRWGPGQVSQVSGGMEAAWAPWGGIFITVIPAEADKAAWRQGPTSLVYLSGPDAVPQQIAEDVHSPHVHPSQPVVAVVSRDGRVLIIGMDGSQGPRGVSDAGTRPRWSPDGTRLLYEEDTDNPLIRWLGVQVFRIIGD